MRRRRRQPLRQPDAVRAKARISLAYPRDPEQDRALAEQAGVDLLFAPSVEEMYPEGFQTWVEVEEVSRGMEGDVRPGHFRGVATICLKLFVVVAPDRAYFGEKDAQQAAVVKRLVRDLALPLEIRLVPTVRDPDGLALSSRNRHLTPDERRLALVLPRALAAGQGGIRARPPCRGRRPSRCSPRPAGRTSRSTTWTRHG